MANEEEIHGSSVERTGQFVDLFTNEVFTACRTGDCTKTWEFGMKSELFHAVSQLLQYAIYTTMCTTKQIIMEDLYSLLN